MQKSTKQVFWTDENDSSKIKTISQAFRVIVVFVGINQFLSHIIFLHVSWNWPLKLVYKLVKWWSSSLVESSDLQMFYWGANSFLLSAAAADVSWISGALVLFSIPSFIYLRPFSITFLFLQANFALGPLLGYKKRWSTNKFEGKENKTDTPEIQETSAAESGQTLKN